MTTDQATTLLAYLLASFPTAQAPQATMGIYLQHLEPLPYERTEAAIRALVLTHQYPSLPTIAEVVTAAGVDDAESRQQLLRAMASKQQLVRDAASVTGWAVGRAQLPPEALAEMNAERARAALPAGPVVGEEQRAELADRLRGLANGLTGGGSAVEW